MCVCVTGNCLRIGFLWIRSDPETKICVLGICEVNSERSRGWVEDVRQLRERSQPRMQLKQRPSLSLSLTAQCLPPGWSINYCRWESPLRIHKGGCQFSRPWMKSTRECVHKTGPPNFPDLGSSDTPSNSKSDSICLFHHSITLKMHCFELTHFLSFQC